MGELDAVCSDIGLGVGYCTLEYWASCMVLGWGGSLNICAAAVGFGIAVVGRRRAGLPMIFEI